MNAFPLAVASPGRWQLLRDLQVSLCEVFADA